MDIDKGNHAQTVASGDPGDFIKIDLAVAIKVGRIDHGAPLLDEKEISATRFARGEDVAGLQCQRGIGNRADHLGDCERGRCNTAFKRFNSSKERFWKGKFHGS